MKLAIIPAILVANLAATIAAPGPRTSIQPGTNVRRELGQSILTNPKDLILRNEHYDPTNPDGPPVSENAGKIPNLTVEDWAPKPRKPRKPNSKKPPRRKKGPNPVLFSDTDTLGKGNLRLGNKSDTKLKFPDGVGGTSEEQTVPSLSKVPKKPNDIASKMGRVVGRFTA